MALNHALSPDPLPVSILATDSPSQPSWPDQQEPLAGMNCLPLTHGTQVRFEPLAQDGTLVLASAFDKRKPCRLRLFSANSAWVYELDAGFCSIAQRFHVPVPAGLDGFGVEALDEDQTLWVLADENAQPMGRPLVWPVHSGANRLERFFERLENDCIAEFGWMGGCVLEAFDALAAAEDRGRWNQARDRWLECFLDGAHLKYQDALGRSQIDSFHTIEATLPMASIVRRSPDHPSVKLAINYLLAHAHADAGTCEGCYTVAYPLMQISVLKARTELRQMAWNELFSRREKLFHDGAIYLRFHGTHRTYRNWARGVAWYLLGNVECLRLAGNDPAWEEVAAHVSERCAWVLDFQRDDGLWDNFFEESGFPPETSGSAGIATALVHAHRLGLIDERAVHAARRCWAALPDHLFIDGWLGGTAPSNKRGEEAQHSSRRASETFGMGLMGQLAAAVHF